MNCPSLSGQLLSSSGRSAIMCFSFELESIHLLLVTQKPPVILLPVKMMILSSAARLYSQTTIGGKCMLPSALIKDQPKTYFPHLFN